MKKDYYTSWTKGEKLQKLAKALVMIEDVTVPETSILTGVPQTVIARAARETGRSHFIKEPEKLPTIPDYFYDQQLPIIEEETFDQRVSRIQEAIIDFQTSCDHHKFHVRCTRCMKILGSDTNYIKLDDAHEIIAQTLRDMFDNGDEDLTEFSGLIVDRLNKLTCER